MRAREFTRKKNQLREAEETAAAEAEAARHVAEARGESVAQRIRGEFFFRKNGKNIFLTLNGNGIHTSPTGRIRGS